MIHFHQQKSNKKKKQHDTFVAARNKSNIEKLGGVAFVGGRLAGSRRCDMATAASPSIFTKKQKNSQIQTTTTTTTPNNIYKNAGDR